MKRRDVLKLGAAAAALAASGAGAQEASPAGDVDFLPTSLRGLGAVAEAVLPGEIGAEGRKAALLAFAAWIHNAEPGRYLEHGYGHTRVAKTAAAPKDKYPADLLSLDAAARARHGKVFGALDLASRQALLT